MPLRSSEAAAIADVLFQSVEALANSGRPLNDESRHRLAARLKNIETPTVRAYPLSLEQDPIHPSSYYLAVDGLNHGRVTPLLLRLGLASSPASGLFPKSILIGRMRPAGGREVVVNAIPFGPTDVDPIRTFTEQVAKSFQPRPQGNQPALMVPAETAPAAFEAFRQTLRETHQNQASFAADYSVATDAYPTVLCAAVRAGWREGYSLGVMNLPADAVLTPILGFTRFSMKPEAAATIYGELRRLKPRGFDFELDLRQTALTPALLSETLQASRDAGRPVQAVIPPPGADLEQLSAIARQHNALLTLAGEPYGRNHQLVQV